MNDEEFNIPSDMDVPELRKIRSIENAKWLRRNLSIRNSNHPNFMEVMRCITNYISNNSYFDLNTKNENKTT